MPPKRKRESNTIREVGETLEYLITEIRTKADELGISDKTDLGDALQKKLAESYKVLVDQRQLNIQWHSDPENKGQNNRKLSNALYKQQQRLQNYMKKLAEDYEQGEVLLRHIEKNLVNDKKARSSFLQSTVVGALSRKIDKEQARNEANYKAISRDDLKEMGINIQIPKANADESGKDELDEEEEKKLPTLRQLPESVDSYLRPIMRTFPDALVLHQEWQRDKNMGKTKMSDPFDEPGRDVYFVDMPPRRNTDIAVKSPESIEYKGDPEYLKFPNEIDGSKKQAATYVVEFRMNKKKKNLNMITDVEFKGYELGDLYWDLTGVTMDTVMPNNNAQDAAADLGTRWSDRPLNKSIQAQAIRKETNNIGQSHTRVVTSGTVLYAVRKWLKINGPALKKKILGDQNKLKISQNMRFMTDNQLLEDLRPKQTCGYVSFLVISTACAVIRSWKVREYTPRQKKAIYDKLRTLSLATTVLSSLLVSHNSFVKTIRAILQAHIQSAFHYLEITPDRQPFDGQRHLLLFSISTEMDIKSNEDDSRRQLKQNTQVDHFQEDDIFTLVTNLRKSETWTSRILLVMLSSGCRLIECLSVADFYIPDNAHVYNDNQTGQSVPAIKQRGIAKHKIDSIDDRNERRRKQYEMNIQPQMQLESGVDQYAKTRQEKEQERQSDAVIPSKPVLLGITSEEIIDWVYNVIRPNLVNYIREAEKKQNRNEKQPEDRQLYPRDQTTWPDLKQISNGQLTKLVDKIVNNELSRAYPGMSRLRELLPDGHPLKNPNLHIFNVHTLRKIYANYSYQNYSPSNITKPVWISKILGHAAENLTTSISYGVVAVTPSTLVFKQNSDPASRQAASNQLHELERKYETLSKTVESVEMECCGDNEDAKRPVYNLPTIKAVRKKKQTDVEVYERVQRFIDEEWIPAAKKLGLRARPTWKDLLRARMSPKTLSRWAKVRRSRESE